jgi:hypothetical protein
MVLIGIDPVADLALERFIILEKFETIPSGDKMPWMEIAINSDTNIEVKIANISFMRFFILNSPLIIEGKKQK